MEQSPSGVRIRTGSRLHFGLLDLSGTTRRVDGGAGLCLQGLGVTVEVRPASDQRLLVPADWRRVVEEVIQVLGRRVADSSFELELLETIPKHVGLGSGTQTALAVGKALSEFCGLDTRPGDRLAAQLGRGGTSGVGTWAFEKGGFIVDGGRAWPDEKNEMLPSRFCRFENAPPCLARYDFPPWGILVVIPQMDSIVSGRTELEKFRSLLPIPQVEVEAQSRLVLLGLMPTILNADFEGFCEAMDDLNNQGMKKRQWSASSGAVRECRVALKDVGFRGVGLSSWGPGVFGFSKTKESLRELAGNLQVDDRTEIFFLEAQNHGAISENASGYAGQSLEVALG